ncbi:MAG: SMP-30/gluconolactonase/LRE family protein [Proteobacteria bacterium]|uniref:SMP-30/gluconolactonase/LRE family protein n=1 Tax=Aquabacterium sp. TaxID=1872578 RepID=UPI0035C688E5|nr:SMP-30/gluconolactonase/LRE family protein [Pseudomonadota bacterium]
MTALPFGPSRAVPALPAPARGRVHWLASWLTPLIAAAAYLLFWPTPISPVAWDAPRDAGHSGAHATNTRLSSLRQIALGTGQEGPEFILAHGGWLYSGLSNGDVVRLDPGGARQSVVVNTGGRPLGLDMDAQGRLLVADAMKGLLRVSGQGPSARTEVLLSAVPQPVPDDPVRYADAVKVGPDGTLWLTDASRRFGAKALGDTFEASVLDILEHSCTGRLIAQDPVTLRARVALAGLCFPNGIAFTADRKHMLLSETGTYRILKVDLARLSLVRTASGDTGVPTLAQAMRQGAATVLIDNLPGYPDNLTRGEGGRVWVGLTKPRSPVIDAAARHPMLRSITLRLPRALWPVPKAYGHLIAFDDNGRVLADLQDPQGGYPETTAATEADGKLFVQSLHAHAIGWMPWP